MTLQRWRWDYHPGRGSTMLPDPNGPWIKHRDLEASWQEAKGAIYAEALDAAREAVLNVTVRKDTSWDHRVCALAAIDALRGEDSITSRRVMDPAHCGSSAEQDVSNFAHSASSANDLKHLLECPCNNADERGCFLISAETGKCVSCTCDTLQGQA